MEAVKAYYDGVSFIPLSPIKAKKNQTAIITILDVDENDIFPRNAEVREVEEIRQKRLAFLGCMNGQVWMADDFDEPLDDMKEYME
jgi:hypothetical protein